VPAMRIQLITAASLFAAIALSGVILVAVPTQGYAQDDMRKEGDKACKTDAPRLCKHAFQGGDMAILQCFQENKARLTGTCRKFLTKIGQLN
jgi:hypothetical protein